MKKLIALIMSALMMFAIVGCDNDDKKSDKKSETTIEETTEETTQATTEATTESTTEATEESVDTSESVSDESSEGLLGDFGTGEISLSESGMALYQPLADAGFLIESIPAEDLVGSGIVLVEGFYGMSKTFDQIAMYFQVEDVSTLDAAFAEFTEGMGMGMSEGDVNTEMGTVTRGDIEFQTVEMQGQVIYFCKDVKTKSIFVVMAMDATTAEGILEIVGY